MGRRREPISLALTQRLHEIHFENGDREIRDLRTHTWCLMPPPLEGRPPLVPAAGPVAGGGQQPGNEGAVEGDTQPEGTMGQVRERLLAVPASAQGPRLIGTPAAGWLPAANNAGRSGQVLGRRSLGRVRWHEFVARHSYTAGQAKANRPSLIG